MFVFLPGAPIGRPLASSALAQLHEFGSLMGVGVAADVLLAAANLLAVRRGRYVV